MCVTIGAPVRSENARAAFKFRAAPNAKTAIFDAAATSLKAFDDLTPSRTERRIVVLISDGLDTRSRTNPDTVIEAALEQHVSFYVIHLPLFEPRDGRLEVVYVRPLDLSMDETLYAIEAAIERTDARRVVLDSISGLEAALAPAFKADFLESLYRLLGALTGVGITILLTVEVSEPYNDFRFTPHPISFLTHDIVLQRYYEAEGELRSFLTVIKARARKHSRDLRRYELTSAGIVVGEKLQDYRGIITAVPSGPTRTGE